MNSFRMVVPASELFGEKMSLEVRDFEGDHRAIEREENMCRVADLQQWVEIMKNLSNWQQGVQSRSSFATTRTFDKPIPISNASNCVFPEPCQISDLAPRGIVKMAPSEAEDSKTISLRNNKCSQLTKVWVRIRTHEIALPVVILFYWSTHEMTTIIEHYESFNIDGHD